MRKVITRAAIAVILAAVSMSCATAKAKKKGDDKPLATVAPAWVDSPTSVYPSAMFLQAVGTGSDRTSAEVQAVRGIAAIFSQNVKSETHATKRMEQAMQAGKMAVNTVSSIDQDVLNQVNLSDIIGVEVKGYWQNVEEGNWQAIAVLDKSKASAIYTSMIQQNDKEVRALMDADASDTAQYFTFETYARFDLAREAAAANEGYITRLQVIDSAMATKLSGEIVSSKQVQGKAVEIAKAIPIGVVVEGDREGRIKAAFANAVSAAGFRTSDMAGERYMITAAVSLDQHETRDGSTVQCRYNVDAPLRDTVADEVLLPYTASGREASKDWESAQYNTFKALEKKIRSAFGKAFAEYIASVAAY